MKQLTKMSRTVGAFEKMYRQLNIDSFGGTLPEVIITVSPTENAYGHMTTWKAWKSVKGDKLELNISSNYLDRPIENIVATLIHEMTHIYNQCNNIQDTSRMGTYHNKKFKIEAEKHMLSIAHSDIYGWTITQPTDKLIEYILDHSEIFGEILINRDHEVKSRWTKGPSSNNGKPIKGRGTNNHSRKYICPYCGNSVRATKEVHICCMDCDAEMIEC